MQKWNQRWGSDGEESQQCQEESVCVWSPGTFIHYQSTYQSSEAVFRHELWMISRIGSKLSQEVPLHNAAEITCFSFTPKVFYVYACGTAFFFFLELFIFFWFSFHFCFSPPECILRRTSCCVLPSATSDILQIFCQGTVRRKSPPPPFFIHTYSPSRVEWMSESSSPKDFSLYDHAHISAI